MAKQMRRFDDDVGEEQKYGWVRSWLSRHGRLMEGEMREIYWHGCRFFGYLYIELVSEMGVQRESKGYIGDD